MSNYFYIESFENQPETLVIDIADSPSNRAHDGSSLSAYHMHSGENQLWTFEPVAHHPGYCFITSKLQAAGDYVIDIAEEGGVKPGSKLDANKAKRHSNEKPENQLWRIAPEVSPQSDYFVIECLLDSLAIDVEEGGEPGHVSQSGTLLDAYTNHRKPNQLWRIVEGPIKPTFSPQVTAPKYEGDGIFTISGQGFFPGSIVVVEFTYEVPGINPTNNKQDPAQFRVDLAGAFETEGIGGTGIVNSDGNFSLEITDGVNAVGGECAFNAQTQRFEGWHTLPLGSDG